MRIAIVNESNLDPNLTLPVLEQIACALELQACRDLANLWQGGIIPIRAFDHAPAGWELMVVLNDADQAGALGYHSTTPSGRPYARVFLAPILANGGKLTEGDLSLSVTLSHEACEMIGNPWTNAWFDGPDGEEYAGELCDAVEGNSYELGGVAVSNFVGPRWFSDAAGPYDRMGILTKPFEVRPDGYTIRRTGGTDVKSVWGLAYPGWKKEGKAHPASRTARLHARAKR